ncbi:extracellular solute-binding protein [Winslowiella iniecta]|uniref:Antibiotic ABC transporter substrate-binding protein n=1 Tax=Winslowiella iniecta TaxID=1560201 RepID=A0A0L7TAE9_9GAMM|nr:extracellular solute-binding protein [Winslowiella iniecta]KOC89351.1 antibiotic ABC transporter substrate-binding protein [Winslowiella iniecta]KOC92221.1 antibiotic ABC transporter substrate-binding protein [Winslowiella iniecta]
MLLRLVILVTLSAVGLSAQAANILESYAFSELGEPKYATNFTHYDYVNPAAPKGGKMTLSAIGTYDNFNRYASRGNPGIGTEGLYDTLFTPSEDEIGSYYPLIAESARYPDDFSWAEVSINPHARFQDGSPITAADVAFTFDKFMTEGVPQFRVVYKGAKAKAISRLTVRIELAKPDRDLILGFLSLPVLPEKFWKHHKFNEPIGYPPLSSGPYRITSYKVGQYITYSRVKDYWAADLPVNRGRNNLDTKRYDYYLDDNVAFEAFKAGAFDFRAETSAKKWATQYRGSNFTNNHIVKDVRPNIVTTDATWLAFNNQKALFSDRRVREALGLAFDFEWMNKALFYHAYKRTDSYFQNTEYAAKGYPDAAQLELLAPLKGKIPDEVFTSVYQPPVSDGSGYDRKNLLKALALLKQAGWELKNKQLINVVSGKPFSFELLLRSGSNIEWVLPFQHNLERLGIRVNIRQVDSSQYLRRFRTGDYDMIPTVYNAVPSPGSALQTRWVSQYIDSSWNRPRVQSPVIDGLVAQIMQHQGDKAALLPLGQALDRVLLWNYFMIPMWYSADDRYAYWNKFSMPAITPTYSVGLDNWWYDVNKAAQLPAQRR